MLNGKERIEAILKWSGYNRNQLGKELGYGRAQILYHFARDPERGVSQELASAILARFPEINAQFVIMGEGPMLKSVEKKQKVDEAELKNRIAKLESMLENSILLNLSLARTLEKKTYG